MIEVSLFADILTLKEALEFDKNIKEESDFQLTSCCCPVWIKTSLIPYLANCKLTGASLINWGLFPMIVQTFITTIIF